MTGFYADFAVPVGLAGTETIDSKIEERPDFCRQMPSFREHGVDCLRRHLEIFEHRQMVNRPEGVVPAVWIRGELVWQDGSFTQALGSQPLGRVLRAA